MPFASRSHPYSALSEARNVFLIFMIRTMAASMAMDRSSSTRSLLCVSSVTGGGILIFRCWHWKPSLGEKEASSSHHVQLRERRGGGGAVQAVLDGFGISRLGQNLKPGHQTAV